VTWMIRCIVFYLLLVNSSFVLPAQAAGQCRYCHNGAVKVQGVHTAVSCAACHQNGSKVIADPAAGDTGAAGCTGCHKNYQQLYKQDMATKKKEKQFIAASYGRIDADFGKKNCNSCHIKGCKDCHGSGHKITLPKTDDCTKCHKGYFVGWDYLGRAPRDDHDRYQRGRFVQGESYLKMLPDIHHSKGMTCGDCHTMQSLLEGKISARKCIDCHQPDMQVIEHRISAHLEKMECIACHAAWAAQEYGTFYLQYQGDNPPEPFDRLQLASAGYVKSSYLKRQDLPPLGINEHGKVAPIRPQFIAYFSQLGNSWMPAIENKLLIARWRAFTPHTVQRGTVTCDGCHNNPRRFLLEPPTERIYNLQQDGLGLDSFWDQRGQQMVNGSFMDYARYKRLSARTVEYARYYVEKWKKLSKPAEISSQP